MAARVLAGLAILAAIDVIVALAIEPVVVVVVEALVDRKVENCPSFLFPFPFLLILTLCWDLQYDVLFNCDDDFSSSMPFF